LASGAEYTTARSRCSAKREDAAKTRKRRYKWRQTITVRRYRWQKTRKIQL